MYTPTVFNSINSSICNFDYFIQGNKGCLWANIILKEILRKLKNLLEGKQAQPKALLLFQILLCTCLLVDLREIILSIHMLKKNIIITLYIKLVQVTISNTYCLIHRYNIQKLEV